MIPFYPALEKFEKAGVRYIVVGGMAALAHGVNRYTADIDFVVALDRVNAARAIEALTGLGLKPRAPVDPMGYADQATRETWVKEKNMMVFSFFDPKDPFLGIDLFVEHPMDFEAMYQNSVQRPLGNIHMRVCGREDLIRMKKQAGRPKDLEDVRILEALGRDHGGEH